MWWNFVLGQAQVNEQAGRGLLPELKNMFIAQCFRTNPTGKYLDKETGKEVIVNYASDIQTCLTTSIIFYGWLLMGVAAIVCFAYIVRAGYIMFTAFGDEAKYAQGKKPLLYALIGLAIAVASGFIINFFAGLLGYTGEG